MNYEQRKAALTRLSDLAIEAMTLIGNTFGEQLAEDSALGCLLCCGNKNNAGKAWYLTLTTNEAAIELRKWTREETAKRVEAMGKRTDGEVLYEAEDNW